MKIYLAGKITGTSWRDELVARDNTFSNNPIALDSSSKWDCNQNGSVIWPTLAGAVLGQFDYVGPYAMDDLGGHGAAREEGGHGVLGDGDGTWGFQQVVGPEEFGGNRHDVHIESLEPEITRLCLDAINRADVIFAWVNSIDLYGTLVEIGYAKALGKMLWIGGLWNYDRYDLPDGHGTTTNPLWFAESMGELLYGGNAKEVLERFIERHYTQILKSMPYAEYLQTEHWRRVREGALDRALHRCQLCNRDEQLHVHHRTYERRGCEDDGDLTVLCRACHERFHGVTNGRVTVKVN